MPLADADAGGITPVKPTETCLIVVEYDNGEDVCSSTFKTKGRHTVHKVLLTVCRTFNIESQYSRRVLRCSAC